MLWIPLQSYGQRCRYAKLRAAIAAHELANAEGDDYSEPVIQMTLYKTRCVGHTLKVMVVRAGTSGFRGKMSISAKKRRRWWRYAGNDYFRQDPADKGDTFLHA